MSSANTTSSHFIPSAQQLAKLAKCREKRDEIVAKMSKKRCKNLRILAMKKASWSLLDPTTQPTAALLLPNVPSETATQCAECSCLPGGVSRVTPDPHVEQHITTALGAGDFDLAMRISDQTAEDIAVQEQSLKRMKASIERAEVLLACHK